MYSQYNILIICVVICACLAVLARLSTSEHLRNPSDGACPGRNAGLNTLQGRHTHATRFEKHKRYVYRGFTRQCLLCEPSLVCVAVWRHLSLACSVVREGSTISLPLYALCMSCFRACVDSLSRRRCTEELLCRQRSHRPTL